MEEIKGAEEKTKQVFQKTEKKEAAPKKIVKIDSPLNLSAMSTSDNEEYKVTPPLPHDCDENCYH